MKDNLEKDINDVLSRGVSFFVDPDNSFKDKLIKKAKGEYKKDLVIKFGVDPTRSDIHLGHAVVLRKLRKFQDLGCKVIFLIGDFTASIGDPTGASKTRPEIEQAEIEKNMKTYLEQVGKILKTDKEVFSWIRNSDWFLNITDLVLPDDYKIEFNFKKEKEEISVPVAPNTFLGKAIVYEKTRMQITELGLLGRVSSITLKSLLWSLRHITHGRLIDRDMFQERINTGAELYMHEMLYPVLQGIDSAVLSNVYGSCDLEIGGTDQHFNMLMGRDVMKANHQEMQAVMSVEIIPGTDGKEKMSKSLDNYIGITDSPEEMFGKVMSIPDAIMGSYFRLATYTPLEDVLSIEKDLSEGKANPRDIKARLAREIVSIYHGEKNAEVAEANFSSVFKEGSFPKDAPVIKSNGNEKLSDLLLSAGLIDSKSDFRRLIEGKAISIVGGEIVSDLEFIPTEDADLRIGKKRFVRIKI